MLQPHRHPRIPEPGELGPDPEPLGTERFARLTSTAEMQAPLRGDLVVLPVPRRPVRSRHSKQVAA